MNDGLSAADILALTKDGDGAMEGIWSNPFVYLVWIMVFAMFGRNGFGFGNDGA